MLAAQTHRAGSFVIASAVLLAALAPSARAAEPAASSPSLVYDAAVATNESLRTLSAGAVRRHPFFGGKLLLGYGGRITFLSGDLELTPARRTTGPTRVRIDGAKLAMLNANIHAGVVPYERLELGFNLDLAGLTVGSSENASFRSGPGAPDVRVGAKPTMGNLFGFGPGDLGSLNSEFYVAWRLAPAWTVRAGVSHFLAAYTIDRDLSGGARRYHRFHDLGFVGLRWAP